VGQVSQTTTSRSSSRVQAALKVEAIRPCSVPPNFFPEATLPGKPRSLSINRHYNTAEGGDHQFSNDVKMDQWPEYVCAILEDGEGRLLLESRPDDARLAAGRLTCFGGRREAGETPEDCLRRELREELNWEPQTVEKRVELWVAGDLVAWFYQAVLDGGIDQLRVAPSYKALLVSRQALSDHPVSPWHAAVLAAWIEGRTIVELDA
jgi:8-oxo-dGTP pyrophosphatase MutT (NUDIX family)